MCWLWDYISMYQRAGNSYFILHRSVPRESLFIKTKYKSRRKKGKGKDKEIRVKVKKENETPQSIASLKSVEKLLTDYELDILASIIISVKG